MPNMKVVHYQFMIVAYAGLSGLIYNYTEDLPEIWIAFGATIAVLLLYVCRMFLYVRSLEA